MGERKKQYSFGGLDTRTNDLYREEGTASDCRNVLLSPHRELIKVSDFEEFQIPRGFDGENGEFLDKLPFTAIIIDIMSFEDHLVIATKIPFESPLPFLYVNKFYKYFENSNTVEFIPFEKEIHESTHLGQTVNKVVSDTSGPFTTTNQEGILYFMGGFSENSRIDTFLPQEVLEEENNLGARFSYDGRCISWAGCPAPIKNNTEDDGTLSGDVRYARILPMKIDYKGRHTFGNYSTHKTVSPGPDLQFLEVPLQNAVEEDILLDNSFEYAVYCKLQNDTSNLILNASDNTAARTILVDFYDREINYHSMGKGQFLFGVRKITQSFPSGPNPTDSLNKHEVYRAIVEDIDYTGNTITLSEFFMYSEETGVWESSDNFYHTPSLSSPYLSNILLAVYASADFTFGHKLAGLHTFGYDGVTTIDFKMLDTPQVGDPASLVNYTTPSPFLFLSTDFEDTYDEASTKLVPPKGRQIGAYLTSTLIVDHEKLYFSDFSIGGTIENYTPFDNFGVGSTERGKITGFFSNETFISVFREEETYYVSGNIFLANYRIQSAKSTRIGCTDPRSIVDFKGAGVFLSKRGFYACEQGGNMSEISDQIETIFTKGDLDLSLNLDECKSIVDFKNEYIYFYVGANHATQAGFVFAYSYYHNEWYLLEDINASGGFDIFDSIVYHSDGNNVFKELPTRLNAAAFYRSNFETLGEASLEKKFLQVLMFTMNMEGDFSIGVKSYKNWNTSEVITDETREGIVGETLDITQRLNPGRSKSLAIEIVSESGEPLTLNGYEYEYSADIRMFKNDDS